MTKRILGCIALGAWLMAGVALQAHHSLAGVYDMKKEAEVSGSVEKIQFVNPHGSMTLAVKRRGRHDQRLGVHARLGHRARREGHRPHRSERAPRRRHDQREVHPRAQRRPLGFLKSVTMPDGRVVQISAGNAND